MSSTPIQHPWFASLLPSTNGNSGLCPSFVPTHSFPLTQYCLSLGALDYLEIGQFADRRIGSCLPSGNYVVRAVSSDEHSNMSRQQLLKTIQRLGTDKYDPCRLPVCHKEFQHYSYDIQAGTMEVYDGVIQNPGCPELPSEFGLLMRQFKENVLRDRGYPVRIDFLLFYHPETLKPATFVGRSSDQRIDPDLEQYLYSFKDPSRKAHALCHIVSIGREMPY